MITAMYVGLLLLLFLVLLRLLLKRKWLVAITFILIFVGASAQWGSHDFPSWIVQGLTGMLFLYLMVRNGLVAIIFCGVTRMLLSEFPVTFDFTVWYTARRGIRDSGHADHPYRRHLCRARRSSLIDAGIIGMTRFVLFPVALSAHRHCIGNRHIARAGLYHHPHG